MLKKTVLIFGLVFILGIAVVAGIFGFGPEGTFSFEEIVDPDVDTVDSTVVMNLTIGGNHIGNGDVIPSQEGGMTDTVILTGPTTIKRGEPVVDGDNMEIPIEIVSMQLTGVSNLLGPITLKEVSGIESPTNANKGKITTMKDFSNEPIFPATSFFDVFAEIEIGNETLGINRYFFGQLLGAEGTIDGWPPPDNTYLCFSCPHKLKNALLPSDGDVGTINNFSLTFHPTPQKKLAKIVIKVLNKIVNSMQLGATKSFNVTVPAKSRVAIGADLETLEIPSQQKIVVVNPYNRDSNIKVCVDASKMLGRVDFSLDVAGDEDYTLYNTVGGNRLRILRNTCFETAAREFQLILVNTGNQPADVEVAIIWSTGAKKV